MASFAWTSGRPPRFSSAQVAAALRAENGNVSRAALRLKAGRATVNRYVKKYPHIVPVMEHARELAVRRAERALQRELREVERKYGLDRPVSRKRDVGGADGVGVPPAGVRVKVVYADEPDVPAAPEIAEDAPPPYRRLPDPEWATPGWPLVEIRRPTSDKFHGELEPGDRLRVPRRMAESWVGSGIARPVAAGPK
jgi:hypothetical protein